MELLQPATAIAHPNIALIKYWGDADSTLHIPANGSISMNLAELITKTTVSFDPDNLLDELWINDEIIHGASLERVSSFLGRVRQLAGIKSFARVKSWNNFPISTGIASSASAFAALSLAATRAAGMDLAEPELSRLARLGSGSACRSVPAGFVEWQAGTSDQDSYAVSIAPPGHWQLTDCIAIVSHGEKPTSSTAGHERAISSLLQPARVANAAHRLDLCRRALSKRDFVGLTEIVELDSNLMHAVMLTSRPPLLYWQPETVAVIHAVESWKRVGIPACFTIDAGPNVHVLCPSTYEKTISERLSQLPGVIQVLICHPGGASELVISSQDQSPGGSLSFLPLEFC